MFGEVIKFEHGRYLWLLKKICGFFQSTLLSDFLGIRSHGIHHDFSPPFEHWKNPSWLGYIGDDELHSYIGMMI